MILQLKNLLLPYISIRSKGITAEFGSDKPYVIYGPSGSGKSTFCKTIVGYLAPVSGNFSLDGIELISIPNSQLIYLSQELDLFPWWTVEEQLKMLPCSPSSNQISSALELAGYNDSVQLMPDQISKGMQKRVSIARALLLNPKVLILDETLSALDGQSRVQILNQLTGWQKKMNNIVIFVSHFESEFNGSDYNLINFWDLLRS